MEISELLAIPTRDLQCELARRNFWEFCKLLQPEAYFDERWHLKLLCETLQSFWERKLLDANGDPYLNLLIQFPPRHFKSRTLQLFCAWILGKRNTERIIATSYNDILAQDFSKFTRDNINQERGMSGALIYADVFPETKIKKGDASFKKWALEGQFFNYMGTGKGGTLTGKGATLKIIDDLVQDASDAYNAAQLDRDWQWYSGTFLSRSEKNSEGQSGLEIICMTPWAKGDVSGRLLSLEPEKWYQLSLEVYTEEYGMLCPSILDKVEYDKLESKADPVIFRANYHNERVDIQGRMYAQGFNLYEELPEEHPKRMLAYCDTADEGSDYLCAVMGYEIGEYVYVVDVYYTKEAMEITEPELARRLLLSEIKECKIESNNGGRGFSRNVITHLRSLGSKCVVSWFHQSANKVSRINSNSATVQAMLVFPSNWNTRWPEYYRDMMSYQREGKNKHDDAPDATTGLVEQIVNISTPKVSCGLGRLI